MFNHDNKFDFDLQYGQAGERWLRWLGTDQAKVEVKTERDIWLKTKNAVFEFRSRGKPSGICATQADYWSHIFMEKDQAVMVFTFRMLELRDFLSMVYNNPSMYGAEVVMGGDIDPVTKEKTSGLIKLPISQLYKVSNPYVQTN